MILEDMDDLGEHYTKWNKQGTEMEELHELTYIESKKVKNTCSRE